jgi:hypothetical protein
MGAIFSAAAFGVGAGTGLSAAGFAGAAFAGGTFAGGAFAIAGFAFTILGAGLVGFTVTFDVAMGFAFVGGRAAFFGTAAL